MRKPVEEMLLTGQVTFNLRGKDGEELEKALRTLCYRKPEFRGSMNAFLRYCVNYVIKNDRSLDRRNDR